MNELATISGPLFCYGVLVLIILIAFVTWFLSTGPASKSSC
ncbi:hypothetical protein EIO60_03023|nr:hypothetical protein [Candidatus Pantoea persica]